MPQRYPKKSYSLGEVAKLCGVSTREILLACENHGMSYVGSFSGQMVEVVVGWFE